MDAPGHSPAAHLAAVRRPVLPGGWEAEEMRGSAREAGRAHLYAPPENHRTAEAENPPRPVGDAPDVDAIERVFGTMIQRGR